MSPFLKSCTVTGQIRKGISYRSGVGHWCATAKNDCLTVKDLQKCRPMSHKYEISPKTVGSLVCRKCMRGNSMAMSRICTSCTAWASSNTELATALLHVEMWKLLPLHHHVYSLFVSGQLRHKTGDRVTNVGQNFVA